MRTKNIKNKSGFTLLEIIIVILILAVLASVMMPKFSDMITTSKINAAAQAVKNACTQAAANSTLAQSFTVPTGMPDPVGYGAISCSDVDGTITCDTVGACAGCTDSSSECRWVN